jgi:hypothetical protein
MSDESDSIGSDIGPTTLIHPDCIFCRDGKGEGWEEIEKLDRSAIEDSIAGALLWIAFHDTEGTLPVCNFSFRVETWKSKYSVIIVPHHLPPAWEQARLQQLIIPGPGNARISQGTRFVAFFREGYGPSGPRSRVYMPVAHIAIKRTHTVH